MKRSMVWIAPMGVILLVILSFSRPGLSDRAIPEDVNAVLQNSCFGCHNDEGRNQDAKDALNLDSWDEYRLVMKIGVLGDITEVIEENKMPPARFLESNPDKKLTEDQKKLILDWAEKETQDLMEGN